MDTVSLNKVTKMNDAKVVLFLEDNEDLHEEFIDIQYRYLDHESLMHMEFSIDELETIHTMKYSGSSGIAMVLCQEIDGYHDEDGEEIECDDDAWLHLPVSFKMYCEIFNYVDSTRKGKKHPKNFRKSRRDVYKKNGWAFNKNGWL